MEATDSNGQESGKRRVLVLCTGNSARSQIAEGLLRQLGGKWFEVHSAGTNPRPAIHPMAVTVMREAGIDLADQHPKNLRQFLGQRFDFIITVCDRAKDSCPVFPGNHEQIHWSFPDPAEAPQEQRAHAFRTVRDEMKTRIRLFVEAQTRQAV